MKSTLEILKKVPYDIRRKRLLYNCRKRGIVENELILTNYLKSNPISAMEIEEMEELLKTPDWTLYKQMTSTGDKGLMGKLQGFIRQGKPLRMPNLSEFK